MTELSVNLTKEINAPIGKVFDAWLDPQMLAHFMRPSPKMQLSPTTNDPVVNGRFEILMQVGDNTVPHCGNYLEIDRPGKLVFTWESPASIDNSIVTLNFKELKNNRTEIKLNHVRFIDEERRADHEGGWGRIIDCLNELMS
ncbi:MAG: SRPBCC domain-containing protein [Pseudomonadales bacterium]|nr:SRPBCC domain-containing protein [Pseudomonadales bacterium]